MIDKLQPCQISSFNTQKFDTVNRKCDETVTACASLKKDNLRIANEFNKEKKVRSYCALKLSIGH